MTEIVTLSSTALSRVVGCSSDRSDEWLPHLQFAMTLFAINTPARVCAFIAQVAHETGGLKYKAEIWGPTPAQLGYEGRKDLGNDTPGDGKRYKGRGPLQLTGRANYRAATASLRAYMPGVPDFEANPDLAETPKWGSLLSALFWNTRSLNKLADAGDFLAITKRINGGTNGLEDRKRYWERAKAEWGGA